jgi:hypothetical protein
MGFIWDILERVRDASDTPSESADTVCGVITGDIIGSSDLARDDRRKLYDVMREAGRMVEDYFADAIALPVDIFAGDTWQILVSDPPMTLRIALFYRSIIRSQMVNDPDADPRTRDRKLDTRLVMAIGPIDFVPAERTSEGEGTAFRLSGRTLKEMKKNVRLAFRCPDERRERVWNTVACLVDAIIVQQWTAARARAVTGALLGWPQEQIAGLWPETIKQATVSTHLREASWPALEDALKAFERDWKE